MTAPTFTDSDLLDLRGVAQRFETVRWDVLDASLTVIGQIFPESEKAAQIENDVNAAYKKKLKGLALVPSDRAAIDTFAHRIRPSWVLQNGSTFPLGVYLFQASDQERRTWGGMFHAPVMVDQTWILDQGRLSTFSVASGVRISDQIKTLALEVGLPTSGIESSAIVSTGDLAWPAGTTRLKIIQDLCGLCGFYDPYFDNSGLLICRSVVNLDTATPDHIYRLDETSRVLADSPLESDDSWKAPNTFLVVNTSATKVEISGTYQIPFAAPNSVGHRGFAIVATIKDPGVQDDAQAAARARTAATQQGSTQWAEFKSTPDPRHDSYAVVEYNLVNYTEQAYTLTCSPGGEMTHKVSRIFKAAA